MFSLYTYKIWVLLKSPTTDPPTHQPTNPPTTNHFLTDPPTTYPPTHRLTIIKVVKTEDQIQNILFTLQFLKNHNHLFPFITE